MAAIRVRELTKEYGDVVANDALTFDVEAGEVFGYLGPNGAGKTTTIRTLMGLQSPTSGTASVLGHDVRDERELIAAKRCLGYLPSDPAFDDGVTGRRILDLHAAIKGDDRLDELRELFDPPLDRPIRAYSTGNRQMLGILQAFMHDPDLVVMDEPTSRLDPLAQERFNDLLRRERDRGLTAFLSSHVLSEVRRVCDRVGILRGGRLVTVDPVEELIGRSGKAVRLRLAGDVEPGVFDLPHVADRTRRTTEVDDGTVTELSFTYTGEIGALVARLDDRRDRLLDVEIEEAPIEDVFMRFYGDEDPTADATSGTVDA